MRLIKESVIPAPRELVFAFHESPGALEKLTPPWEKVRVIERSPSILPGSRVVLRMWTGPFTVDWIAEHTEYERNRMFADRQVKGPFTFWYHKHMFADAPGGGTLLRDEVEYLPPFGFLGRLARPLIERKLKRLFDYRHEMTRRAVQESAEFGNP